MKNRHIFIGLVFILALSSTAWPQVTINVSLENAGSAYVQVGTTFELQVIGTFDSKLSAIDYKFSASGSASAQLTGRVVNELSFISSTSQQPLDDNLPYDLTNGPFHEVLMDMDYAGNPGGTEDGIAAGTDVLIETIEITPTSTGILTISISDLNAATTQGSSDGSMFDTVTIAQPSVVLTVIENIPGDLEPDGDVDLADVGIMAEQWLQAPGVPSADIAPDPLDNFVDLLDFIVLVEHWLEGTE